MRLSLCEMAAQKKRRRIPPTACLHHRRMLAVASALALLLSVSFCQADADNSNGNSNSNNARQPGELLPVDSTSNDDDVDASILPKMVSIEDVPSSNVRSGDVEDAEEEAELGAPVATPGAGSDNANDGSVPLAADQAPTGGSSVGESPGSSTQTAVEHRAAQAGTLIQVDGRNIIQLDAEVAAAAVDAAAAAPYSPTGTTDAEGEISAAAVADVADTEQGFKQDPKSHQRDANVLAVGKEAGGIGSGMWHASKGLDAGAAEALAAAGGAAATIGVETPVGGKGNEDEVKDAGRWVGSRQGEEAVGGRDESDGHAGMNQNLIVGQTKEASKEKNVSKTERDPGETATSGDTNLDSHDSVKVSGSGANRLSVRVAVPDAHDDDGASGPSTTGVEGDTEPGSAANTLTIEREEQQQQQQQRQKPVQPTASQKESSLDAQVGAADTAQVKDTGETTIPPRVGDDVDNAEIFSRNDGRGGGSGDGAVVGVDAVAEPSPLFDVITSTAAYRETQPVRSPGGLSSPTVTAPAAAVANKGDVQPLHAEGSRGRGGSDGDRVGGSDGKAKNDDVDGRARTDSKEGGERPEDVVVETGAVPGSHSKTSGNSSSSDGQEEPRAHETYGADVEQGHNKNVAEGHEETIRSNSEGGVGDLAGGASDDTGGGDSSEFPRGSSEETAQRVRDMEAELVRKLLAEEDAKSLLDIWVEEAREYILTRTVPPTDAECDFNWSRLRCEPKCTCGARLRFGDYTPGRACRLLHPWERNPELCSGGDGDAASGSGGGGGSGAWDPSDEPALRRVAAAAAGALVRLRRAYEARVAPPSDAECSFSLETRRCEPQSLCRLRFRWGDLTPSSSCRLTDGGDSEENEHRAAAAVHRSTSGGDIY